MATLNFGRLALPDYTRWETRSTNGKDIDRLTLWLRGATLADTKVLRTELRGHEGDAVAITYSTDADIDGFYIVDSVRVSSIARQASLQGNGVFRADVTLTFIGGHASTQLQSLTTRVSAVEDHATTPSYWWAPALGAQAVDAGGVANTLIERDGEDGTVDVAIDIAADVNPTWSIAPASYYAGAVEFYADDELRTGTEMPMDVDNWYISNGLMQVRPGGYQSASNGKIEVRFHDGTAWGTWVAFIINWAGTNALGSFDFVTCLVNTPEQVIVRMVRDALEAPTSSTTLHELDLNLRRGGRLVTALYKFTGAAATHSVEADVSDTATRPGGNASYSYLDTLVSGDRIIWGTPKAFTLATLENTLDVAAQTMPFWLAAAVDNAADATGNGPADLAEQYVGQTAETVRPVRR